MSYRRQRPWAGWLLRIIGRGILLIGVAATLTGLGFVRIANEGPPPPQLTIPTFDPSGQSEPHPPPEADTTRAPDWFTIPLGIALMPTGVLLVLIGRKIVFRGKQGTAKIIDPIDELDGHRFVLYLRPFLEDRAMAYIPRTLDDPPVVSGILPLGARAYEEMIAKLFRQYGEVVAVGEPGERLPLPGARRFYLPVDDWQETVSALMRRATLILLVATPGPGTIWELTEAVRIVAPTRLVLVVCHGPELYERFREAATTAFAKRQRTEDWSPPTLPPYPPGDERNPNEMMIKGFVSFDSDWRTQFRWFEGRRRQRYD
jgi:hypothetical protein